MKRNYSKGKKKIIGRNGASAKKKPAKNSNGKESIKISGKKNRKKEQKHPGKNKPMPVVGIGSSAGGLEAISKFLESLPPNLGMAYVYIQHLSPNHESLLPEILERKTSMPVMRTEQDMPIKKDHVYVIPANKIITISDGTLKLQPRPERENFYPIDSFFISLANTYQENAIGVLLSGTGTDGTLGLKALKTEGGITFAQDDTARYHDMPHHASEMGYVDFIMPPDKIALQLSLFFDHDLAALHEQNEILDNDTDMRKIETIMHTRRNVDFSHYKKTTIHRRILRRMVLHRLKDLGEYARLLKENSAEVNALYQDLLITVTNFFRDPGVYVTLAGKMLPVLLKDRRFSDTLRIWIPGCATGEEAISMAITVLEHLGEKAIHTSVQIFATDLNEKAVERARVGIYLKSALQNVSPDRLEKFFTKIDGQYQVIKAIREMIIYAPHNLLNDPPFSRMDIISCQNVLIYLETNPQNKIMHAFHYALKSTGYLILGKSESIGSATDLFEQLNKDHRIYRKKNVSTPVYLDFLTRPFVPATTSIALNQKPAEPFKEVDLEKETEKVLLKRYMPASVLVNKDMEILRFRGSVSKYLEPATGKASLHLMKMVKEELVYELRSVINQAKKESVPVRKQGLHFNDDTKDLAIEVIPVKANGKDNYFLIIFQPENGNAGPESEKPVVVSKETKNNQIVSLQKQVKEAREHIRIISEEFEASKEELQSSNEEVLSSNEELQSINEELETSKEELQSTNEELTTINDELQLRNSELIEAANYTKAVLETMHESLLMLSSDLKIKTANKGFYQTFRTTPEVTEGFSLFDIGNRQWDIPELKRQLKMVAENNIPFVGFEVTASFPGLGVKSMILNAQKFTKEESTKSLIIFSIQDITTRKQYEDELKDKEERFRLLVQNSSDIVTVFDKDGTIKYESPAIESILGYRTEERIGRNINIDPIVHPDDRKTKLDLLRKSVDNPTENISGEFRLRHKNGTYRTIDAIFRNLLDDEKINGIIANYRDISERKALQQQKDEFIGIASHELKTPVTSIKAYTQILQDVFVKAKDKKSADMLEKMNNQVDRLTVLIVDLLDFTRIEGGKLKFREENYNLNDLVSEVIEEMQRTTKQHKIEKRLDKSVQMYGDRDRTGQVLTNLLNNAIKYSPQAKKIIVSSKIGGKNITICVKDFGIGIKKDHLNKVFERFFRVSESQLNTFPGLGLGLYIAAEIVKRQDGSITVTSTQGKGSTFCFSLPINR